MGEASLIMDEARSDKQLFLFCGADLPLIDRDQPRGEFTGERLFERDRDRYDAAVRFLGDPGVSLRQICELLHLSSNTVRGVAARERIPIETARAKIVSTLAYGVQLAADQVIEKLPGGNLKDSAIALNILATNMQLVGGQATSRVEVVAGGNIFERFQAFHEQTEKLVAARVVDSEIGFRGEKEFAKAGELALPAAGEPGAGTDVASGDLTSDAVVIGDFATKSATDGDSAAPGLEAAEPAADQGEEGVSVSTPPPVSPIGNPSRNLFPKGGIP